MNPFYLLSSQNLYHEGPVTLFKPSILKNCLFSATENALARWNLSTGDLEKEIELKNITALKIHEESSQILVVQNKTIVKLSFDLEKKGESAEKVDDESLQLFTTLKKVVALSIDKSHILIFSFETLEKTKEFSTKELTGLDSPVHSLVPTLNEKNLLAVFQKEVHVLNINEEVISKFKNFSFDEPISSILDLDDRDVAVATTHGLHYFQKDCDAPFTQIPPFQSELKKVCSYNEPTLLIVTAENEVMIWHVRDQKVLHKLDPIAKLADVELWLDHGKLFVSFGKGEDKIEIFDAFFNYEEELEIDTDYFNGLILNKQKEGFIEEIQENEYFRGYYEENQRRGPCVIIRPGKKITGHFEDNLFKGRVQIELLREKRLIVVGDSEKFWDNLDEVRIEYLIDGKVKVESMDKGNPILGEKYSGKGRLTFANQYVFEGYVENNRIAKDQKELTATIVIPGEAEPSVVLFVESERKFINSRSNAFEVDYDTGEVTVGEVDI